MSNFLNFFKVTSRASRAFVTEYYDYPNFNYTYTNSKGETSGLSVKNFNQMFAEGYFFANAREVGPNGRLVQADNSTAADQAAAVAELTAAALEAGGWDDFTEGGYFDGQDAPADDLLSNTIFTENDANSTEQAAFVCTWEGHDIATEEHGFCPECQ